MIILRFLALLTFFGTFYASADEITFDLNASTAKIRTGEDKPKKVGNFVDLGVQETRLEDGQSFYIACKRQCGLDNECLPGELNIRVGGIRIDINMPYDQCAADLAAAQKDLANGVMQKVRLVLPSGPEDIRILAVHSRP